MEYNKEIVKEKLRTNRDWMEQCIKRLYQCQTNEERLYRSSHVLNGMGFNSSDSKYLCWWGEKLSKNSNLHLSGEHLERCSRILPKYWKQVLNMIREKEERVYC